MTIVLAVGVPDANLALNAVTFLALAVAAVPFLRGQRLKGVIAELEQVVKSHSARIEQLDGDLESERKARAQAERDAAACNAKYEELQRYAAPDAFKEMAESLTRLERTVETAFASHGELVLKLVEQSTRMGEMLNRSDRGRRGDEPR